MRPVRAFVMCPGLGVVNRGYETFARECFDALTGDPRLDVYLFKGGGPSGARERAVWSLHRYGWLAESLGRAVGRHGYYVEVMTFLVSLLPHLARLRPDVLFFSDVNLRTPLWHWRRLTRQRFRMLLSNGGPVGPPFPRCEHVHQVLPGAVEEAVTAGHPPDRQTFVPYGFAIPPRLLPLGADERRDLRVRLGLPPDRPVLLSVGALNASHKRMDYVVREVAAAPAPRPFLLLLGAAEVETPGVVELGDRLLGSAGFRCATVPPGDVPAYYRASDAFVLASLTEGFGRVYVEALSHGLPCLAHDYPATRYILAEHGTFGDFRRPGALTELLRSLPAADEAGRQTRHWTAYNRFSWAALRDTYVQMLIRCAGEQIGRAEQTVVPAGRSLDAIRTA